MRHLLAALLAAPALALAATPEIPLTIKNHRFEPAQVRVPAGKKAKLVIRNEYKAPEEFESHELNREKVIPGGTTANVFIGPLEPGKYPFFGEFNEATAQGVVIAE